MNWNMIFFGGKWVDENGKNSKSEKIKINKKTRYRKNELGSKRGWQDVDKNRNSQNIIK